jgi:phosphoserine phosphatase
MKLKRGNWSERNYDSLNALLAGVRPGETAVFDWDNTCIFNDIGEALLRRMTFELAFRFDAKAMAAMIPDRINGIGHVMIKGMPYSLKKMKGAILPAYKRLKAGSSACEKIRLDEDYRVFTSGLLALNRALEETPGIGCEFAYPWVNTLLQGLSLPEFERLASSAIGEELRNPIRRRGLADPLGRWRYGWTSGIRLYPEMKDLAAAWHGRGGCVVVSTASNRQLVERMIASTGFSCRQVIGMELAMAGSHFGDRIRPELRPNLGVGKVANIRQRLARDPVLVAGDSSNDYEMLTTFRSTRMRLVIDHRSQGEIALVCRRARAGENGYLAQEIDPKRGTFKAARHRG